MSIATELVDMETFINDAYNAAEENGATMPTQKNLQNLKPTIESIEGGGSVVTYTVTFDSNGGTEVESQLVTSGEVATMPVTPTKEKYVLNYWALDGIEYDFSTPVTSNITLVAVWKLEYTELEYIESTGTQYIDTGVVNNQNIYIEDIISGQSDGGYLNGSEADWQSKFKWGFSWGKPYIGYKTSNQNGTGTVSLDIFYTFKIGKGTQAVDGVFSYSDNTALTVYSTTPILLFALFETDHISSYCKIRRKSTKIYENKVLIRDYIPVLDKKGVACLYDKITETYLYNAGTGAFTAGPIVV